MIPFLNLLTGIFSFVICLLYSANLCEGYSFLPVLPLLYTALSAPLLKRLVRGNCRFFVTTSILVAVQWIRCVFAPAIGAYSGFYADPGNDISTTIAKMSVRLCMYELIIIFVVALFVTRKKGSTKASIASAPLSVPVYDMAGSRYIYWLFAFSAIGLMVFTKKIPFHFFILKSGTTDRFASQVAVGDILSALISYGITFLLIVLLFFLYQKYLFTAEDRYYRYALYLILIRLMFISSESRLSLVYQCITALMLFSGLFAKNRRKTIRIIGLAAVAVIGALTVYKVFYAFLYDSYYDALLSGMKGFGLSGIAQQMDSYFYGLKTVALNLSFVKTASGGGAEFFADILRNTFGFHYLIKSDTITTLERYNLYLYAGGARSGYLFSAIAHGYLYVGPILAPLATVLNFAVACWMEKWLGKIRSIDIYYIFCTAYVRFAVSVFASFGGTWNFTSRTLLIGMAVVIFASAFKVQPARQRKRVRI